MNIIRNRIFGNKPGGSGSGGGSGGGAFNGERAISRNTPGINGFDPNTTSVVAFLEQVFYPSVSPLCAISINDPIREIGASKDYTLTWSVTERTNAITGITVDGNAVTPTGNNQAGTSTGTVGAATGSYTKNMSVTDGTLSDAASCTLQYLARMFWGTTIKDGLYTPITDADILALANSNLATSKALSLSNFGGGATRLIFAFPTAFGAPTFTVNGLANTAFTCVRSASAFVNAEGATVTMDVWVSNNIYNSPLDSIVLS